MYTSTTRIEVLECKPTMSYALYIAVDSGTMELGQEPRAVAEAKALTANDALVHFYF